MRWFQNDKINKEFGVSRTIKVINIAVCTNKNYQLLINDNF